jgi:hypothetical protein
LCPKQEVQLIKNFNHHLFLKSTFMRKLFYSFLAATALVLTGCVETIQEITLNADGSGTVTNTNDMSALIGLAKKMGGAEELEKAGAQKIDSTVSLKEGADSIPNLTDDEKQMMRKGTLKIKMDLEAEKFTTSILFPFSKPSEIPAYNKLSGKIMAESMKERMAGNMGAGGDDMPEMSSFDDYYTMEYSNGELTKKLNKEKYANVESDQYLKSIKEAASMGLKMKATYIINLPRAAQKAEGKGLTLSADGKKVTVVADIDDFFEDASALEFKIKY